eukprot:TRINITY_DN735_c0_g1_i1.p1 TRINITY_DN735_c0_g1~~TRINITY_DN735_c0_g1_i1.p1  ORF type:complete len:483 (+),score=106.04 TRINITY_DN735_c0_g1_i1:39-1487(+)
MVNVVLIVFPSLVAGVFIIINLYLIAYYQHPLDKNTAYIPKLIVLFCFWMVEVSIIMLTMDVGNVNVQGIRGTFPMGILWLILYVTMAGFCFVICPYTSWFYELESPDGQVSMKKRIYKPLFNTIVLLIFVAAIMIVFYIFLGIVELPVVDLQSPMIDADVVDDAICNGCTMQKIRVDIRISFVLYLISITAFFSNFLFVLFTGIGLAALPVDLYMEFKHRPRLLPLDQWADKKLNLGRMAEELIQKGRKLQNKYPSVGAGRGRSAYNAYKRDIYKLEERWGRLKAQRSLGGKWTQIKAIVALFLSWITFALSVTWWLHILIYVVWPGSNPYPFLNNMLIAMDDAFPFSAIIAYAILSFYLLWAAMKGLFRFGLRLPFFFAVHPIKIGGTFVNSFLFNSVLAMLISFALTAFCTQAFKLYTRNTDINIIFSKGSLDLKGIRFIWKYIYWGLLALPILTILVMVCKGRRKHLSQQRRRYEADF